ncbi:hypothetical protein KI372_03560 [Halobacterium salinarum]|uniref:hypothetical protein n=1 Tax=Halobacterium salinarum TaxID=2242 RepID=UPI001F257746|nr:hypothetical protein [Halobacterium salinarum]MCF2206201.1 hypothetical protein [Halobacterium salinarum]MCF2240506.1 hypothetical protein [Halobacterium salinarum]
MDSLDECVGLVAREAEVGEAVVSAVATVFGEFLAVGLNCVNRVRAKLFEVATGERNERLRAASPRE